MATKTKFCGNCGKIVDFNSDCDCLKQRQEAYRKRKANADKLLDTKKWKTLRKKVIENDNFLCQRCLHKYDIINSSNLTVHHIKSRKHFPELTFEEDNLITLCRSCNSRLGDDLNRLDFKWEREKTEEKKYLEVF